LPFILAAATQHAQRYQRKDHNDKAPKISFLPMR